MNACRDVCYCLLQCYGEMKNVQNKNLKKKNTVCVYIRRYVLKLSAREVTLLIELSAKKNVSSSFIRSNDEGTCEACKRQVMYGQKESNCKF